MWLWLKNAWPWRRRNALAADLIASMVDFDDAMKSFTPDESQKLMAAHRSLSVVDQIGAAIAVRLRLAERMTMEELVRYVQHLQNRYSVAVGAATYAKYSEGIPQDVFKVRERLWAELQTLSYRLRLAYAITHIRDYQLQLIRFWCFACLVASLLFILVALTYQDNGGASSALLNFLIVGAVGFGGAVTSIARRADKLLTASPLDADPVIQASALQQGTASLMIAFVTGPVFALALLLIFLSHNLQIGQLTPNFHGAICDHGCTKEDFRVFHYVFWFDNEIDAAKLALWAFIAGFAEQFVPDVLDRFANLNKK